MTSRTEGVASLLLVLFAASCSEAEGDAGATTTAAGSGGGSTSTAVGPMAATTTANGAGGSGGLGSGGSEGGGTTGQGGCLEPAPPEVCHAIEGPFDCDDTPGCGWYWNVDYFTLLGDECDRSFRDFCLSVDVCVPVTESQGYFRGEEVIEFGSACGLLGGWTPCSGAEGEPPACACTQGDLVCD